MPRDVQLAGAEVEPVPVRLCLQPLGRRPELPAQPEHVAVRACRPGSDASAGHSAAMSRSTGTVRLSASASIASTARRFCPRISTTRLSTSSRNGPSTFYLHRHAAHVISMPGGVSRGKRASGVTGRPPILEAGRHRAGGT